MRNTWPWPLTRPGGRPPSSASRKPERFQRRVSPIQGRDDVLHVTCSEAVVIHGAAGGGRTLPRRHSRSRPAVSTRSSPSPGASRSRACSTAFDTAAPSRFRTASSRPPASDGAFPSSRTMRRQASASSNAWDGRLRPRGSRCRLPRRTRSPRPRGARAAGQGPRARQDRVARTRPVARITPLRRP